MVESTVCPPNIPLFMEARTIPISGIPAVPVGKRAFGFCNMGYTSRNGSCHHKTLRIMINFFFLFPAPRFAGPPLKFH